MLAVLLSGYQHFIQNTSMINRLYGELYDEGDEDPDQTFTRSREVFEDKIERYKDFEFGYCTYILIRYFMLGCCCDCLSNLFQARFPSCRKKVTSYKKFLIA